MDKFMRSQPHHPVMSDDTSSPIGAIIGSVATAMVGLILVMAVLLPVIQSMELGEYSALIYLIGIIVIIGIALACLAWFSGRSRNDGL